MSPTPRRVIGAAIALVTLTAAACGSDDDARDDSAGSGDAGWSFTDDLGTTVELEEAPPVRRPARGPST